MKKVSPATWREKVTNLIERRKTKTDNHHLDSTIANYEGHLSKIKIGQTVLDVGCGSMYARQFMPAGTIYLGVDAFPVNDDVVKMKIEQCYFKDKSFDTVIAFAVLDGVEDLSAACHQMTRVCKKNILILTGIDIEPDEFHTFSISEKDLLENMKPFRVGFREWLSPKVLLIEFVR